MAFAGLLKQGRNFLYANMQARIEIVKLAKFRYAPVYLMLKFCKLDKISTVTADTTT